jgi:hypothetical protein
MQSEGFVWYADQHIEYEAYAVLVCLEPECDGALRCYNDGVIEQTTIEAEIKKEARRRDRA